MPIDDDINHGRAPIGGKRDARRIDPVLDLIREIWRRQPDTRLGQLVRSAVLRGYDDQGANVDVQTADTGLTIAGAEDDVLVRGLHLLAAEMKEQGIWRD